MRRFVVYASRLRIVNPCSRNKDLNFFNVFHSRQCYTVFIKSHRELWYFPYKAHALESDTPGQPGY